MTIDANKITSPITKHFQHSLSLLRETGEGLIASHKQNTSPKTQQNQTNYVY